MAERLTRSLRAGVAILAIGAISLGHTAAYAVPVTAVWNGGAGDWTSPSWTFSTPPGVVFPDNDATNQFNVQIDGNKPAVSAVELNKNVTIDSLKVDGRDSLAVNNSNLAIVQDAARPASGQLDNAGRIALNSIGAGTASLQVIGNVTFSGGGLLTLSGPANTVVFGGDVPPFTMRASTAIFGAGTLTNENHTIAGTGSIGFFDLTIKNLVGGVIDANVAGATQWRPHQSHPCRRRTRCDARVAHGPDIRCTGAD